MAIHSKRANIYQEFVLKYIDNKRLINVWHSTCFKLDTAGMLMPSAIIKDK
jgi:hypothetical protein